MRAATRLTEMMLAYLTAIGIAYTVVAVQSAAQNFRWDLKDEACIAQRSLIATLPSHVEQAKWDNMHYASFAIGCENLVTAALHESGRLRLAVRECPITIPPVNWISGRIKSGAAAELIYRADGRWWFCRIESLGSDGRSYLLPAQDWMMLRGDRYRQIARSLLTRIGVLLAGTIGVLALARRYMARLPAGLLKRVETLCDSESSKGVPGGGRLEFIPEEFRRLNQPLAETRLLQASERKWQQERRKLNADKLVAIATLASGFAHEIGTPLGVIRGLAEMLLTSTFEQSEVTENLEVIITQIDQISRLVTLLLDLGRCRSAMRVKSDVRSIAERAIQLIKSEAARAPASR